MKLQDPRLEALLAAYREERRPSPAARERMWARWVEHRRPRRAWVRGAVIAAVAVAALVLLWLASRGLPGELARGREPGSGVQAPFDRASDSAGGTAVAAGGRAVGSGEALMAEPADARPASEAPAAVAAEPSSEGRASEGAGSGSRTAAGSKPASSEPATDSERDAPIDDLALVEAAEAALRAGTPARALELLREHEQRFPSAPTAEERQALRVLALCAAGREVEGRGARWAFLREHPRSAYRERIENACPEP